MDKRNRYLRYFKDEIKLQMGVFKGTVSVILIDPPCKDRSERFTTVPLKP